MSSCSISYKMNGANINYQTTHSISIADFPNNAPLVNPSLSNALSEGIRDLFQRQTRLQMLRKGGDLEIEGEITGYTVTQGAISADGYASESKLTITIAVHFTNNVNPEDSFDKTYSSYLRRISSTTPSPAGKKSRLSELRLIFLLKILLI